MTAALILLMRYYARAFPPTGGTTGAMATLLNWFGRAHAYYYSLPRFKFEAMTLGLALLFGLLVVPPLIYLAIVTLEGQFLTPTVMGRRLELNPFAVFLAIAFCTWLWGPIGAFLAVPLLMALTVTLGHAFSEEKPELPE